MFQPQQPQQFPQPGVQSQQQPFSQQGFPQQPLTQPQPSSAGVAPNAAVTAINDQLFRPNQPPGGGAQNAATIGIAGVASTFKGPSIKIYRERSKYNEWEFVYNPTSNQPQAQPGAANNPLGQPGQQPGGAANPNPFGQPGQPPAGGANGIGQSGQQPGGLFNPNLFGQPAQSPATPPR